MLIQDTDLSYTRTLVPNRRVKALHPQIIDRAKRCLAVLCKLVFSPTLNGQVCKIGIRSMCPFSLLLRELDRGVVNCKLFAKLRARRRCSVGRRFKLERQCRGTGRY
ncbi:hypothetical protein BaRGS_00002573 [Batillaria attramentaria]|uniref:Uncharacterized protein n=1 Tax=Batillaria attramentaria TaxID=370345 RepID=A0ABD0M553_9CAEN